MYISEQALTRRAAELERVAQQMGLEVPNGMRTIGPIARIGHLATRLGIDLCQAFDLERAFLEHDARDPCLRSLH